MSFLDLDEWLIELTRHFDVVYSPVIDVKVYPEAVDVALIEGAVANDENLHMLHRVRQHTRTLIAFGDCAVTGNVTSLRNPLGVALEVLRPVYVDTDALNARVPQEPEIVPVLLDRVQPLHAVVEVDYFLPGCPPSADRIRTALQAIIDGKPPLLDGEMRRFG
jgi:NAD-reducing hydrogenase small subunit